VKKFELRKLELEVDKYYKAIIAKKGKANDAVKSSFYQCVRDLAYAILKVGKYKKYDIDFEDISYEYAVHLYMNVADGSFRPDLKGGFPWQFYISKNILHVILGVKKGEKQAYELLEDLNELPEDILVDDEVPLVDDSYAMSVLKKAMVAEIMRAITIFYPQREVDRLLPMCSTLLSIGPKPSYLSLPKKAKEFSITLVSIAKRVSRKYELERFASLSPDLNTALRSAVRSSVFLSSVANTDLFAKNW